MIRLKEYLDYLQETKTVSNVKYIDLIDKYDLPKNRILIFGSSVLAVHGLRKNKDLDIIVPKDLFKELSSNKLFTIGIASSGEKFLKDRSGNMEIYFSAGILKVDLKILLKRADNINGYLFMSVEDMIRWKKKMGREKDLEDVKLLETVK